MSTPHARNIVRKLLAGGKNLRIQEIYKRGLEEFPATPFRQPPPPKRYTGPSGKLRPAPPQPPNPTHPFRSRSYLKHIVLPDLAFSEEVEKFHTLAETTPGTQTQKRPTKSKEAISAGQQDIWLWRLTGPQAKEEHPKLEKEPEVTTAGWHQKNELYPRPENSRQLTSKRDPYGAGPLTHLNKRRQNARPEKLRLEKEWTESIAAARAQGSQTA